VFRKIFGFFPRIFACWKPVFASLIKSAETGWFYARHIVIQGAGHFFASDPILEPGSRSSEAAGPIRRFFKERL